MSSSIYKTSAIPKSVSPERIARLLQVIAESGLGRRDFARRLSTTESNLSEMLNGRSGISVPLAERIARAFGVSPGWLLFGEESTGNAVSEAAVQYNVLQRMPIPRIGGGHAARLPEGMMLYEVEGDSLEPVWPDGRLLMVVKTEKGETGPAVIRIGRVPWRVVGVLF